MAPYGWRHSRSVADGLFEEGHRFSFVQAVRLLEEMAVSTHPDRTAPAEGADPAHELVRFRHAVRLDFPASDVEEVQRPHDGGPAEVTVNVLGLAGALGPLPPAVSELIVERSFRKDTAFRDFLDIFNHRLISMLYRARKKYRPALDMGGANRDPRETRGPHRGRVASVLHAFLGLGTPHLRGRMKVGDRALLPYTGLILDRNRSTVGLVRLLADYFEMAVAVVPFRGRWHALEDDDLTRIGESGANRILGRNAVLGSRVWNEAASIEVQLGPLTFAQFRDFLPTGRSHDALVAVTRFYLREEIGFTFRLELAAARVPKLRIGKKRAPYLGWTSWLKTRSFTENDTQVRLKGRA
jgi:type VI secretion system protein ImpH